MMYMEKIKHATTYQDINDVLEFLTEGVERIFGDGLVRFYLTGSLSYGDFDEGEATSTWRHTEKTGDKRGNPACQKSA